MPGRPRSPFLPLPKQWNKRVRSPVLHAISLAQFVLTCAPGCSGPPIVWYASFRAKSKPSLALSPAWPDSFSRFLKRCSGPPIV